MNLKFLISKNNILWENNNRHNERSKKKANLMTLAGLFLAAYFAVRLGARNILILFAFFLTVDFMMAFWTQNTIPMSQTFKMAFTYLLVIYLLVIHVKIFKQSYKEIDTEFGTFKSDKP